MIYEEIRQDMSEKGYVVSDEEFADLLLFAKRKAEVGGQTEDYIKYLLPDVIKEQCIRNTINARTAEVLTLDRELTQYIGGIRNGRKTAGAAG